MSWRYDKESQNLVFGGVEKGIAPSPHLGVANLQNANINTETGEVTANYNRVAQTSPKITGQTLAIQNTNTLLNNNSGASQQLKNGTWITISGSSGTPANGNYYVFNVAGTTAQTFQISSTFQGSALSGFTGSVGTFSTVNMGTAVQGVTENYADTSFNPQQRNYILDTNGFLWVNDTGGSAPTEWHMGNSTTDISNAGTYGANPSGLALVNGYLLMFAGKGIYYKETVLLGTTWTSFYTGLNQLYSGKNPHFAITSRNAFVYYTDGNYIGSILPSSVSSFGNTNTWSYGIMTSNGANPSTFTVNSMIGGNFPVNGQIMTFTTSPGGSYGTIVVGKAYYVTNVQPQNSSFQISTTVPTTIGQAGNVQENAISGTAYFNSFSPGTTQDSIGATISTQTINNQALALGNFETAQCLTELGVNLLIGCKSNNIYFWNEIPIASGGSLTPAVLPETNTINLIQANNVAYIFAGSKGNIYVTNGSSVSLALTVPDYCAGVPGTPQSYVDPVFTWGGGMFLRGRIFFSIQDQTASKTGNCGGIWSFIPSYFNPMTSEDMGIALRLENTNSYGSLNGFATVLLPSVIQTISGPQYWTGWTSSVSSPTFGIDASGTVPVSTVTIETDLVSTGTILGKQKKTFENIQYKLASPLVSGESVAINYRQNRTDAWLTAGSVQTEGATELMGYISPIVFQSGDWLQLQIVMTTNGQTSSSFVPFRELYLK